MTEDHINTSIANASGKITDERFAKMSSKYAGVIIGISPRKPLIAGVSPT